MARKVILDVDPGVADALALCLALGDPRLEVVAVTATGGVTSPEQATRNALAVVEHIDPPHRPRFGAADPQQPLHTDGRGLFGSDGLCGVPLRVAELHHPHRSIKVLADEIRAAPEELTIIACGPLSNLASVLQFEPDLATQIGHLMIVGGTVAGPGNVTASAEFNIFCDAFSAHQVFASPVTKTLLPLDVTSRIVLNLDIMHQLPEESTNVGRLLHTLLPGAFQAYRRRQAMEGIFVHEAVGIVAALHPELFDTEPMFGDVETSGELTRGATVLDRRRRPDSQPNMEVAVDVDARAVVDRMLRSLLLE